MVQSGLEQEIIDTNSVPRVSQYRLAAHLSAALTLYIGMVHTALSLRREMKLDKLASSTTTTARQGLQNLLLTLNNSSVKRYRRIVGVAGAMVLFTAVSGAFVAGLDAGLVYNEFPYMGENIIPPVDELMDKRYARAVDGSDNWWRNMLENPVTAQFDHRLFVSRHFCVTFYSIWDPYRFKISSLKADIDILHTQRLSQPSLFYYIFPSSLDENHLDRSSLDRLRTWPN